MRVREILGQVMQYGGNLFPYLRKLLTYTDDMQQLGAAIAVVVAMVGAGSQMQGLVQQRNLSLSPWCGMSGHDCKVGHFRPSAIFAA